MCKPEEAFGLNINKVVLEEEEQRGEGEKIMRGRGERRGGKEDKREVRNREETLVTRC